jgi:hypothetical protein
MAETINPQPLTEEAWFDPRPISVKPEVDNFAVGQAFLCVLWFSRVSIIPPMLHTHTLSFISAI